MLSQLRIENLVIVEAAEIDFSPGLNAITGETGAGKTVLISALELALGGRAATGAIRSGQRLATVEAIFEPPFAPAVHDWVGARLELDWEPEEPLTLRREVSSHGRSRGLIAGQLVGVADLKRLGELLVDLHGQHEHQSLFHLAAQRAALDAFGSHEKPRLDYAKIHEQCTRLKRRRAELLERARDFDKQFDFLTYQIEEIEEVNPTEGEATELEAEEARLAHAEALALAANQSYTLLYEGDGDEGRSVLATLREVGRALDQIGGLDPEMTDLPEKGAEIEALIEDLALRLRDYAGRCEANPRRLESVIARLEAIGRLRRKHGARDEAELLRVWKGLRDERDRMSSDGQECEQIDAKLAETEKNLKNKAERLFKARKKAAAQLDRTVTQTLKKIGMAQAKFETRVDWTDEFTAEGGDRVEFLLAANVGEGKRPLRETASGGELSRTMLAIKTALAERDAIPTLVFDEIDAGIDGKTAARVAAVMAELAASHQILCITHHASIAARGARHISIRKSASDGRTRTSAIALKKDERIEELAKMMGGDGQSAAGKKLARQLLGVK